MKPRHVVSIVCVLVFPAGSLRAGEISVSGYFDIAERMTEMLPREQFLLPECVRTLGPGYQGAWKFVRDEIRYVPYEGSQKGAEGTLASGEGNSLDQARLLAALLASRGFRTRICRAKLPEAARLRLEPPKARKAALPLGEPARLLGVPEADLEQLAAASAERARTREGFILGRTDARVRQIAKALGRLPGAASAPLEEEHFWVQCQLAAGSWRDFDPSAALEEGKRLADPEARFAPGEIPEKLLASYTIRLLLNKEEILRFSMPAALLCLKPMSLGFVPVDPEYHASLENGPAATVDAYRKVKRFRPVFFVEDESRLGRPFDLDGRVYKNLGTSRTEAARRLGSSVGGIFGGGRRRDKESAPAPWRITLELSAAAGGKGRDFTRELIRSGDPEEVRVRLLSHQAMLLVPGAVPASLIAHRHLRQILANREVIEAAISGKFRFEKDWARIRREPVELLAFARAEACLVKLLPRAEHVFLPPHLVGWEERSRKTSDGIQTRAGIDIFFAPLGSDLEGAERSALGLYWGALLTELERVILEVRGEGDVMSAARHFFVAEALGVPLKVLRAESDLTALGLPKELRETMAGELGAGRTVITPERPAPEGADGEALWGYYALDARTGEVLGRLSGGRGQAAAEYAEQVDTFLGVLGNIQSYADFQKCLWGVITAPLSGKTQVEMRRAGCYCFVKWAFGGMMGSVKGLLDVDPSPENVLLGVVTDGIPGSSFGGINGGVGEGLAQGACGHKPSKK